ncbi:MAG: radical SAM protein, partial [Verrucomicrobiota bacterium]|nr:radical SAM protein [Verrucomicrobiota bacterium]
KEFSPETIIIFGGPNYGSVQDEMVWFWKRYPLIDFYVAKEGEIAIVELVRALHEVDYNPLRLKKSRTLLGNCHYWWKDELIIGKDLPRVKSIEELPSPYLDGLMDKFFDGVLTPLIHTTRGCPFKCTFCTEGADYYNKVAQRVSLENELRYIAERIGTVPDLGCSDANFGMFKQDLEKAKVINSIQKEFGWPKRFAVSTGKNMKERVISVAQMLGDALNVAAALQSTDENVLDFIKRDNISLEALDSMRQETGESGGETYTELILALPGDSKEAHTKTLKDVIDADMGIIRMYQLILLPQTELNTPDTRNTYEMKTKHRLMPRSFGRYEILGKKFCAIESEEICIENISLPFNDYVECRELDMTVEIAHNGGIFNELKGFCKWLEVSWFDFLMMFFADRRSHSEGITELYDTFREQTTEDIFDTRDELDVSTQKDIDLFLDSEGSSNEMANAKVFAFFRLQEEIHEALFKQAKTLLKERGSLDPNLILYLNELEEYCRLKKVDVTSDLELKMTCNFDFAAIKEQDYAVDPLSYKLLEPREITISHTEEQKEMIKGYVHQYGTTLDGLGRILMRVSQTKRLFRQIKGGDVTSQPSAEENYWGERHPTFQ